MAYGYDNKKQKPKRPRLSLSRFRQQRPTLRLRSRRRNIPQYYLAAQKRDGDWGLYGPRDSYDQILQLAQQKCETPNWNVETFNTSSLAEATRQWKAKRFETDPHVTFSNAFNRVRHQ